MSRFLSHTFWGRVGGPSDRARTPGQAAGPGTRRSSLGADRSMVVASAATASAGLRVAGALAVDVGFLLVATFTWRVFRTVTPWATALVAGLALGLLAQLALAAPHEKAAGVVQMLLAVAVYGWTALEASIHVRMQQRRIALGIGDPVVANRLWLWAVMGGTSVFAALVNAFTILYGVMPLQMPAVMIVTTASGLVQSTTLLLALAPPTRYLDWLERERAA